MKHCEKCNINTNTQKRQCPICFNELDGEFDADKPTAIYNAAKYTDRTASKNLFLIKLFLFLTISIGSVCLYINLTVNPQIFWSAVVILAMVYVWILVYHTILSSRGLLEKVLFQFVGILAVILASNLIDGSPDWFWNYVVPSASLATISALGMVLLVNKKRSDYVLSSFVMAIFVIATSLILILTNTDTFKLLNIINLFYSGLFIVAILIFGAKALKRAFHKTWHI